MSEIGGDFHWPGLPFSSCLPWPEPHTFFSTGRAAVVRLVQPGRLWVPSYFCPHTTEYWRHSGLEVVRYLDHPARSQPDWTTLHPIAGDSVIAVNYFGIRRATPWQDWRVAHPSIVLIEDHTHDPLSEWARQSKADYAFASLRKTFPVPDGALVWSPAGHLLPTEPTGRQWTGSALKLAAMIWKRDYIASGETAAALKTLFRQFQIEGEEVLAQAPDQRIAPWSYALLHAGFPTMWRYQREENVRQLLARLPVSEYVGALFDTWPQKHCPFNVVLIVDTAARREDLRQHFITAGIYPPVHWPLPEDTASEAKDVARRVLTLPVDHRCTLSDLDRIVNVLKDFLDNL